MQLRISNTSFWWLKWMVIPNHFHFHFFFCIYTSILRLIRKCMMFFLIDSVVLLSKVVYYSVLYDVMSINFIWSYLQVFFFHYERLSPHIRFHLRNKQINKLYHRRRFITDTIHTRTQEREDWWWLQQIWCKIGRTSCVWEIAKVIPDNGR